MSLTKPRIETTARFLSDDHDGLLYKDCWEKSNSNCLKSIDGVGKGVCVGDAITVAGGSQVSEVEECIYTCVTVGVTVSGLGEHPITVTVMLKLIIQYLLSFVVFIATPLPP